MQIEQDFGESFESEDNLFTLWPTFARKIVEYGAARCPSCTTLLDLDTTDVGGLSQGTISNVLFVEDPSNILLPIFHSRDSQEIVARENKL